jgi:AcrR family transcriptional regulator
MRRGIMPQGDTPDLSSDQSPAPDMQAAILDAALAIAEEKGQWSAVRLHDVADRLQIPTAEVLDHYRDLDSVADAWFLRGLKAMVAPKPADFMREPAWRRIEICLLAWFDALAPHRRVTAQMLRGKLHLPHLHHWGPMIFNLSRVIHWLREAAQLPAPYGTPRASREEFTLTAVFVAALMVWTGDDSEGQADTRAFLRRELR